MTDIITPIKQGSRFKEHFDILLPTTTLQNVLDIDNDSMLTNDKPRSMSISPLTDRTPKPQPLRMHSSPDMLILKTNNNNSTINLSPQQYNNKGDQQEQNKENQINLSSTINTTPKVPLPTTPKKPINVAAVQYKGYTANSNVNSLNRGDVMIKRLSNWIVILKLTSGWLDEIEKWTSSTTFKKQKKENPDLYGNINKRRKEYHHTVSHFKKECRDKIHQLKTNTSLQMEELLLRANETKKCMNHLSQLCKYAEDTSKPRLPEMDPWLGNLHVLRYLKRETTEENRLRELMVPIQKDMKELETKINENLKTIIQFCAEYQTTVTQYGDTYDQFLQQVLPQPTWQSFVEAQQKDWVDENHIQKNYLHINYPNKSSPYVATVQKGLLGRRSGVLKNYHKRFYVLTHYGYLHQFKLDDKVKPESSIFITSTTIQPPVNDSDIIFSDDIDSNMNGYQQYKNNPDNDNNNNNNENNNDSSLSQQNENKHGYIFEIHHKSKLYYFKTKTSNELVTWCKALNNVAKEISIRKLLEQRRQKQLLKEQQLLPTTNQSIHSIDPKHHKDIILDDDDDDDDSEFHSIHSGGEDSSMNNTALIESDIISLDIGATNHPYPNHNHNESSSNFSNNNSSTTSHSLQSSPPLVTTTTTTNVYTSSSHQPIMDESVQLIPPKVDLEREESAIYFSSTSSPSSSSSTTHSPPLPPPFSFPPPPPPLPTSSLSNTTRRGVATYQTNLNLDL